MPGAHRDTDKRKCDAATEVVGNSTVFVNNLLWAVEDDVCDHGGGRLKPVTGPPIIYVENKFIICAPGDTTKEIDLKLHPPGANDPAGSSTDTFVYGG